MSEPVFYKLPSGDIVNLAKTSNIDKSYDGNLDREGIVFSGPQGDDKFWVVRQDFVTEEGQTVEWEKIKKIILDYKIPFHVITFVKMVRNFREVCVCMDVCVCMANKRGC